MKIAASTALLLVASACGSEPAVIHVHPGDEIQPAIERAAALPKPVTVVVHAGTYRPQRRAQALIWFNERHDGVQVEARGHVVLSAANPELAKPTAASYPAVVNHVVYFGDGITRATRLSGFEITGANNFVTTSDKAGDIEPNADQPGLFKSLVFYADGGGIKVFGRSYPTIERVRLYDNYASPCAGGLSVEHRGYQDGALLIRDSIFDYNRTQVTGSAIDVLRGSSVVIENCLFVDNLANLGEDFIGQESGHEYNKQHGSGALTVFPTSVVRVVDCTFTNNWNGVDDKGTGNVYRNCIFWRNERPGGISPGARYELDILDAQGVSGCYIGGGVPDLRGTIDASRNVLDAPDPEFDAAFVPQAPVYAGVGYRP